MRIFPCSAGSAASSGPAQATARMQALDTLLEATDRMPIIAEEGPDILVKYMDIRGGSELHRRIRNRLIANGRIVPTEKDLEQGAQIPQADPTQVALRERLQAQTAKDAAAAARTQVQTAVEMTEAERAEETLVLEIAQAVANVLKTKAETREIDAETAGQTVSTGAIPLPSRKSTAASTRRRYSRSVTNPAHGPVQFPSS